jgi:ribonuclease BN (tRNA processing enzyme)
LYCIVLSTMSTTQHGASAALTPPLSLETDGQLRLVFIGAGSAFTKKNYQNNLLVIKGPDHVLIDCGTRAPEALSHLGLSVSAIRNYLITHSHADHVGGLEEVMLLNRYMARQKTTMIAPERYRRFLWNKSLAGGAAYNERTDGRLLRFDDFWDVIEPVPVPGADRQLCEAALGGIKLSMFRTMHIPDSAPSWRSSSLSYGVVIDDRIAYTSDTRFDPGLIDFLESRYSLDTIFHDCQLFKGGVHAALEELAELPAASRAKTYLMHYGDAADAHAQKAADLGFKGFAAQWQPYDYPIKR